MGLILIIISCVVIIVPLWKICGKTGFSPAISLFIFVPVVGWLILFLVLAFKEWPTLSRSQ